MNYLAHLHIAYKSHSCLLGNFLGDFVKGNPQGRYPLSTTKGIMLHRKVDAYTDVHPRIVDLKQTFPSDLRRFAPIALDIFWDHGLSLQWANFESLSLEQFCHYVHQQLSYLEQPLLADLPGRYLDISQRLRQGNWLASYGKWQRVCDALIRVSERRPGLRPLKDCIDVLEHHYDAYLAAFTPLYQDVLAYAADESAPPVGR